MELLKLRACLGKQEKQGKLGNQRKGLSRLITVHSYKEKNERKHNEP